MEEKQFLDWIKVKIKLNKSQRKIYFRERDVYWVSLGKNVGSEQDGKNKRLERPVLVLKKFNDDIFIGLPITSQIKNDKYHYIFESDGINYSIILSQIRLLSSKRLLKKRLRIEEKVFENIKNKLKGIIF